MPTSDGERLRRRFLAIPERVRRAIAPAVIQSADELVRVMKQLAPNDGDGRLQASIAREAGPHELAQRVVAGGALTTRPVQNGQDGSYDYAMAIEYGTVKSSPHPFFRPAERLLAKKIKSRLKRAASKAVKEAFNGK